MQKQDKEVRHPGLGGSFILLTSEYPMPALLRTAEHPL